MEGVPCVASVDDLPGPVDLAVITVPPPAVPEVAEQCGRHGVQALIVISESRGAAGAELLAACRRHGMRLLGPSCFGVIMPWIGLDATFTAGHPVRGVAGLMVQSGGVGIALLEQMSRLGIGVSSFTSAGDKYDVSPTDLLTWWAQDEVTQLAVLYVESFGNPRKFAGTARRVAQQMPVLTVIGARSPAGHRAASHTAAAPTPVASQEAMFDLAVSSPPRAWVSWSMPPRCWPASRCRRATGSRSWPTRAGRARWPPTPALTTACRSCGSARPRSVRCAGCCRPLRW